MYIIDHDIYVYINIYIYICTCACVHTCDAHGIGYMSKYVYTIVIWEYAYVHTLYMLVTHEECKLVNSVISAFHHADPT